MTYNQTSSQSLQWYGTHRMDQDGQANQQRDRMTEEIIRRRARNKDKKKCNSTS